MSDNETSMEVNAIAVDAISAKLTEVTALAEQLDLALCGSDIPGTGSTALASPNINRILDGTAATTPEEWYSTINKAGGIVKSSSTNSNGGLSTEDGSKSEEEFVTASECTCTPPSRSSSFHTASEGEAVSPWWEQDIGSETEDQPKEATAVITSSQQDNEDENQGETNVVIQEEITQTHHLTLSHDSDYNSIPSPSPQRMKQDLYHIEPLRNQPSPVVLQHHEPADGEESNQASKRISDETTDPLLENIKESRDWLELKVLELTPALTLLGSTLQEAAELQRAHHEVLLKIQSKQSPVEELLRQADQLIADQKPRAEVYSAMADSLALAWRDVNSQLQRRKDILDYNVNYHSNASVCLERMRALELACRGAQVPVEVPAIKELLSRLNDVRRAMLESLMAALQDGRALLDILQEVAQEGTLDSRPDQIRTAANCAVSQVEHWLESLHDRRRLLEVSFQERKTQLEQCLSLALLTIDLQELENVLEEKKESLHCSRDQLGDSDASSQLLLHEHRKLLPEAKELQEQGLKILKATEQLASTGHFAGEDAIAQAYQLLNSATDYIEAVDQRDALLNKAISFFRAAQIALGKLDQLEIQLNTKELPRQSPQLVALHSSISRSIEEATESALQEGYALLEVVPGAESLKRKVEEIENHKLQLNMKCVANSEESIRASKALNNFLERQNQLYSWLVSTAEAFIQGHQDMGSVLAMAKDFLQLHYKLLNELQMKGTEINALLSSLPSTLELLDEEGKIEVQSKADQLRENWGNLKHVLEKRSELARTYVKFHTLAVDLAKELDELDDVLHSINKNEAAMKQLEQKWVTAQQLHMQLVNSGNNFLQDSALKVGDPYLDVERARLCVSTLTEHFTARKNTLASRWSDWEAVITQNRHTTILWERNMTDTNKTVDWVSRLDAQLYPILNEESSSAKLITSDLELRLSTVLPEVKRAQSEIQLRIQTAEDLIGKGEIADRDDTVIVRLKELQQKLQTIITDYQVLLEMLIAFFKNLSELERTIEGLETEYGSSQMKTNLVEVEKLLKEHDASRQAIMELFKFTLSESQQIINKIKQQEPESSRERDIWTVKRIMEEKRSAWERAWTDRRLKLEQMQQYCQFDTDLSQIHDNINQLEQQLVAVRGQYGESLASAKSTSLAFLYFEKTIDLLEQRIETFVSAAEAMLNIDSSRASHIKHEVLRLRQRWEEFHKQVFESRRLIDLSIEFFSLVEEAEDWFREGSRLLVTIARRSSVVRTPEEATELLNELETFLKPGEVKQDERIEKITLLADQLFGADGGPAQLVQVKAENREMKDSFSQVSRELRSLAENLHLQQQQLLHRKQEPEKMEVEHVDKGVNVSSTVTEIIERSTLHEFIKETKEVHHKSPSPPPKKAKYKEEEKPVEITVAPNFIIPLVENALIDEGDQFTFECRVTGTPFPDISWLKDGISIQNNPDYQTKFNDGFCSLTIEETFTEDSAKFTCRAQNAAGTAETSCRLSVKECEPEDQMVGPHFVQPLTSLKVSEGTPCILSCKVEGNPLPTVQWYKDDVCIDHNSDYSITYNNGDAVLKIECTSVTDQGEYSCRATNKISTDASSAQLNVEPKQLLEAPKFVSPLSNVMASAGQKIKLECKISGEPTPTISWLFNGKEVKESQDLKLTFENGTATLVVNEVVPKDAGMYSVHAVNSAGEATESCQVSVKGRLLTETSDSELASDVELIKPTVQLQLKDTAVFEGMKVRLDCVIVGQPEPEVIWFHDEKPVKESPDFQLLFHGDRCSLIIQEAYLEDAGEYKVVAINSAGEASSKCKLTVQSVGGSNESATRLSSSTITTKNEVIEINEFSPRFTQLLTDVLIPVGEDTSLQCSVEGSPSPSISWLHNNKIIEESDRIKWEKTNDGMCTLKILNVRNEDKGNYICRAQNSLGEAKCFAHLIVKGTIDQLDENQTVKLDDQKIPPSFTELFADRKVHEGEPSKFECIVNGKPTPKVRWLFNDAPVSGKDFLVSTSGPRQVLSIPAVLKDNVGRITCVAENEAGKASCVATLTISDARIDDLLPSLESINLSETSGGFEMKRAIFSQSTTSRKEVFSSSSTSSTAIEGHGEPQVQMQSVTSHSELASQKIGDEPPIQVEHHKTLEYHYQDGVETQQKTEMKSKTVGEENKSTTTAIVPTKQRKQIPPRFISPVMGRIVDQGADVILEAIIESFPIASVKWTKNGQDIVERTGVSMSWELNKARLSINNVTVNDAGKYTCTANNPAGTASSTADLVVKKSIFPPVMGRRLQGSTAVVGERVNMEIEVTGTPDPDVTWYKDGVEIPKSSSMFVVRHHGNSHSLLIEKATLSHSGQYSVKAVNSGGEAKSLADFYVMEPQPKQQVIEVTKDSEEQKSVKQSVFTTPPSQIQVYDSQIKKESEKFEGSCIITETIKTDKQVSIKVSHSPVSSSTEKTEFSTFQEEKKSPLTPIPIIESPIPPQARIVNIEVETKPEIIEVKPETKTEETVQSSETEESETHLSKRDALDFFKNIIKVNKEEQERLPKKSESPVKPSVTSPLLFQPPPFESSSQEYFQSEESVTGYKKEFCEIIDKGPVFNLEPGPPPEMGFIPKVSVTTKKEELVDRVKRLEESHRQLSDEEVPSGAVRIFPVPTVCKEPTVPKPVSPPQTPTFFPKLETKQVKETVKDSVVEEQIVPEKFKSTGVDEKTYRSVKAPVFPQSDSKLSPVYRPQADISLRPQSPRPSAEAVSMEKLWTARSKENEELTKIIKSEETKRTENSCSRMETDQLSMSFKQSSLQPQPEFNSFNGTYQQVVTAGRPVSPLPSAEGVAMDRVWSHKHSESTLKTSWPPPAYVPEVKPNAPWIENKKVGVAQQKSETQEPLVKTSEEIFKKQEEFSSVSKQAFSEKTSYSSSQFQSFDSQKSAFVENKPVIRPVSAPWGKSNIPSVVESPKIIYVAEAHASHKVNLPKTTTKITETYQSLKSEYSESFQSVQDRSIVEESILKPSEAKKIWPPGPKNEDVVPFPKKTPHVKKVQPLRPMSAQELRFDDLYLEPGPPPEIGFAEPPKSERRQSHVEIIEQDLEKDLVKEPSRRLVGAVRIIPPPPKKEKLERSVSSTQQTFISQTKKSELKRSNSLSKDIKPFEPFPQLEPFPFKPDPPKPKPKTGTVPKPSKFKKHSFTESDYESDFESSKIPPKWAPYESDSEGPLYRKVKPPSVRDLPKRPHSVSCDVIPPTQFEQPPPLQGPTRPSSCLIPDKSTKEIKTKTITSVEETRSKNAVVKQFQSSKFEKLSSIKPGPAPVYVEAPQTIKTDVEKHKPDSPKSKQKVSKPLVQAESGYMADTDEPRGGTLKHSKATSSEQATSVAYSSSSSSSSFTKQQSFQQKQFHSSSSINKVPASVKTTTKKDLVSHQVQSFPPPKPEELLLEPFPFKTEPARTTKRTVGPPPPSPSKFVKGEFRESDYESDYEGRIPVKWRPHDSDTEDVTFRPVHPVLSSPVSHKSKQSSHSPAPPSVFESPPQITGTTRPKFEPVEKSKKSSVKIKEVKEKSVVKPKPVPAQKSPPIEKIVATPALGFNLKPGSPPKMDYAPPPQHFRIPSGTHMETSNTMSFAEATESSRRVVSMQQTTRVIKFDESKSKKSHSKFTSSHNKLHESDYESDYDSLKINKSQKPLPITQNSSQTEYIAAEQKRLQRVEEMRKRFSTVEPPAVEPVLTPGEPPQFGFIEPKIPASATNIANKHMSEMTQSFKSKAQKFASDVVSDIKTAPKQNGVSPDKPVTNTDDPQAYREESRLSEYGTKHIDPDTGLIYFKYDFGYEFGVVLPGEGGKTVKSIKKQIASKSSSKEEGSIEVPVIHETTIKQQNKPDGKKLSHKSVKWEQTSESEMSDIDGDISRRRHKLPQPSPQQKEPHIYIPHSPSPQSLSPSVHSLHSLSPYYTPGHDSTASPGSSVGPISGFSPGGAGASVPSTTPPVVNASTTPEHSRKAPLFITPLRDIAVLSGQAARFECIVQAEPLPNILWAKDGRILQPSDQHNIQFRNGVCRLTMQFAMPYDAGNYTCTATNLLGTAESSASLLVSGERRPLH